MKKILCVLAIIFLFPLVVNAESYDINTSYDEEKCILTISGNQIGHEATVSIFKNNELAGFKTDTITNGNYSVDFVLSYENDTKINITVSNEDGENEITKTNVNIPTCVVENNNNSFNELFDENSNSLIKKQGEFEDGDHFELEDIDDEEMQSKFEEMNDEEREVIENIYNIMLNKVGEYRQFLKVLNVKVKDRDNRDRYYEDYNGGFILNVKIPKEAFSELNGLKFAIFDDTELTLSDEIPYEYDEDAEILTLEIDRPCTLIAYIDNDYEFLDNTENPTFNINKDKSVKLKINADYPKFKDVFVDGKKIDKKNYKDEKGSTVIIFNEDYLKSLSQGEHNITVYFNDGKAITNLKITKNPLTGDKIVIYVTLFMLGIFGLISVKKQTKKL